MAGKKQSHTDAGSDSGMSQTYTSQRQQNRALMGELERKLTGKTGMFSEEQEAKNARHKQLDKKTGGPTSSSSTTTAKAKEMARSKLDTLASKYNKSHQNKSQPGGGAQGDSLDQMAGYELIEQRK